VSATRRISARLPGKAFAGGDAGHEDRTPFGADVNGVPARQRRHVKGAVVKPAGGMVSPTDRPVRIRAGTMTGARDPAPGTQGVTPMKTLKTLAILAVLSPTAALADVSVSTADLDAFRTAVTSAGCTIDSDGDAGQVESATGFDEPKLEAIVNELRSLGEIEDLNTEGGIRLISGDCAPR